SADAALLRDVRQADHARARRAAAADHSDEARLQAGEVPVQPARDQRPVRATRLLGRSRLQLARRLVMSPSQSQSERLEHPSVVRLCHWAQAIALAVLIPTGLQIFNAFPSFGSKIPERDLLEVPAFLTLGGWLAGALQWHFTFAWLLILSLIVYVFYQAIS